MIIKIQDGRPQFTDFNLAESAAVRHSELKENKQFTHNRESKTVGLAGRPESACKRYSCTLVFFTSLQYSSRNRPSGLFPAQTAERVYLANCNLLNLKQFLFFYYDIPHSFPLN